MREIPNRVRIQPLDHGRYLAICDAIQGCHAEGETVAEALENIEDVARILLELQKEENLPTDRLFDRFQPGVRLEARLVDAPSDV